MMELTYDFDGQAVVDMNIYANGYYLGSIELNDSLSDEVREDIIAEHPELADKLDEGRLQAASKHHYYTCAICGQRFDTGEFYSVVHEQITEKHQLCEGGGVQYNFCMPCFDKVRGDWYSNDH